MIESSNNLWTIIDISRSVFLQTDSDWYSVVMILILQEEKVRQALSLPDVLFLKFLKSISQINTLTLTVYTMSGSLLIRVGHLSSTDKW